MTEDVVNAGYTIIERFPVGEQGFAIGHPVIEWSGNNTYIQSEGINQDFGIYNSPDELLKEHGQEMSPIKEYLYRNLGRHLMNSNVKKIRNRP